MSATFTSTIAEFQNNGNVLVQPKTLPPIVAGTAPLPELISHFIRLWSVKIAATVFLFLHRLLRPASATVEPTLVKTYPCRPTLRNRIFYPPSWTSGSKVPLYLDIHGGGFAFGDPQLDDEFCSAWAKRTGMLVVSLDYRKSPLYQYPIPVDDIAAVAGAVIDDSSLPIDKTKIAMGGFSAGGTLALSASQLPGLKGLVKAVLPFYPVVDWSTHPSEKFRLRLYRERSTDSLEKMGPCMSWGYIPATQDRRDGILSVMYARKEDLPHWIMMVAPQHDILTRESREMMMKLAGIEKLNELEELAFEKGTLKWHLVEGTSHGFTHSLGRGERGRAWREQKREEVYAEAHKWLESGPLA